jgi:hypothetical protein
MNRNLLTGLVIVAIIATNQLLAQQTVGTLVNNTGTYDGFTLFTARHYHKSYLINNEGRKINEWTQPDGMRVENCRLLENGQLIRSVNLLLPFYTGRPGAHGKLELVNWDGTIAWSITYADSSHVLHHDVVPLIQNDGSYHFLASTWDVIPADTAIIYGRNPNMVGGNNNYLLIERLLEIEPVGTDGYDIVWEWSAMDHLVQQDYPDAGNYIPDGVLNNPQLLNFNYFKSNNSNTLNNPDWMHVSGLGYNPTLDQIVFSNHGSNELMIIDHSTTTTEAAGHTGGSSGKGGDILYRWGNPKAYDANTATHFQALHSPYWIPDGLVHGGKIMVINNGYNLGSSSIEIITPPIDTNGDYVAPSVGLAFGPQNLDWSYIDGSNFYTGNMGNGQRLQNGNTLINEAVKGRFFEIDTNKNIVWEYRCPTIASGPMEYNQDIAAIPVTNPNGDLENEVYRIYKYPSGYPGFTGHVITPGDFIELNNPLTSSGPKVPEDLLRLYPNPTSGIFTISREVNKYTVQILSTTNKVLREWSNQSNLKTIDISNLPSGLYFVKVVNKLDNTVSVQKIIKQ